MTIFFLKYVNNKTFFHFGTPYMTQIYILYYLEIPSSMFRSKQNNKEKNCDPSLQDWSCCKYQKCGAGQGHCSDDTDCAANLFCGKGNCAAGNSSMNCCEGET